VCGDSKHTARTADVDDCSLDFIKDNNDDDASLVDTPSPNDDDDEEKEHEHDEEM
jgi:hypothetical protein